MRFKTPLPNSAHGLLPVQPLQPNPGCVAHGRDPPPQALPPGALPALSCAGCTGCAAALWLGSAQM